MLILAFDTATAVATSALVRDGETLAEGRSTAVRLLAEVDRLLRAAAVEASALTGLVVGTGPGSFTGLRAGLASARALSFGLGVPVAGVSTLDALAAAAPGALPVIDAKRREIFTFSDGVPICLAPADLRVTRGALCLGDGAVRYRETLERAGGVVPPDDSPLHLPRATLHAALARDFGPAARVEPIYLRVPDAERAVARAGAA